MYTDYVATLNLSRDITGFTLLDPTAFPENRSTLMPEQFQVQEICFKANFNYYGAPDFIMPGIMDSSTRPISFMPKSFEKSSHILAITGIPKGLEDVTDFSLREAEFSSYWEDMKYGYLFQIISKEHLKLN